MIETTSGTLLGGRVRYAQPRDGYRTGIEPVLLAASVPARAGETVIEAGTGAGAALMCLAARVPGVAGVGVELDAEMAALARQNVAANGMAGLTIVTGDVLKLSLPSADHAMSNPPWHDARSTEAASPRRRLAKQEREGVEAWVAALARAVRHEGSVTLILPAGLVGRATTALGAAGWGGVARHEFLPKPDRPARLVLLQARRGGAAPSSRSVLHAACGGYMPAIEAVLRAGAALRVG